MKLPGKRDEKSILGGMKAVIVTDCLQSVVMLSSMFILRKLNIILILLLLFSISPSNRISRL